MGEFRGKFYPINDDKAGYYYQLWQDHGPDELVELVLKNAELWGADLSQLKVFAKTVADRLYSLMTKGGEATLAEFSLVHKKNSL